MGEHTPAWYAEYDKTWGWAVRDPSDQVRVVAGGTQDRYIAHRLKDESTATLIAAAPALLEAARIGYNALLYGDQPTYVDPVNPNGERKSARDILQAAIAAARPEAEGGEK